MGDAVKGPLYCLAILFCLIAMSQAVNAQNLLERMVTPGPLIEGHAKLESDCGNCHRPFSKKSQSRLCLDCHDKVDDDLRDGRGFHGLRKDIAETECKHCHTDHVGRDADIVRLDPETFDHHFTDFALNGAHKIVPCTTCHATNTKFRDAPAACIACHEDDEPHKGRLGRECGVCHKEDAWRDTKPFDHDKTEYPLVGAHKKVGCKVCHTGEVYKDLQTSCVACHRLQDIHKGKRGEKCEACHSSNEWKTIHFDHDKDTKFPLRQKHSEVRCDSCHRGDMFKDKLSSACVDCHRQDDVHKGQLGKDCARCHSEAGWSQASTFDHGLTRFPLIGQHTAVPCEECHLTQTFKGAPSACEGCHKDEFHQGRLGQRCAACHNPNGWALWRFDHNTQTQFPLTGAHAGLGCHGCHTRAVADPIRLPQNCYACHRADDIHDGAFGRRCEQCHTTDSFSQATFRR